MLVLGEMNSLHMFAKFTCTQDETLADILSKCCCLRSLHLAFCRRISDRPFVEHLRHCPRLRSVDLSGCGRITNATLVSLARSCRGLEKLELFACKNLTDKGILEPKRCVRLRRLNIAMCTVSKSALQDLQWHCPMLQIVHEFK